MDRIIVYLNDGTIKEFLNSKIDTYTNIKTEIKYIIIEQLFEDGIEIYNHIPFDLIKHIIINTK